MELQSDFDQANDIESCECTIIHEDVVRQVRNSLTDETSLYDLAELFKIFGDSTRIRIMSVLFESELCVCDIACLLGMTQSAISHQLRILKQSRLVRSRKAGKSVYYSLADEHVQQIFNQGLNHIHEG
jgi:ArsR family transcriptional regulator, lead/cadmium/zinc/bismuth-responsive transcriptional repressor